MANQDSIESNPFHSPIEVKTSRADTPVPVVEGIHLHSIYNPAKEAEGLIQKYEAQLEKQSRVLVLGLGFGYHVWALESLLRRYHENWQVTVIEPDPRMVATFNSLAPVELSEHVKIVSAKNVSQFYDELDLVRFMAEKPLVLAHPSSFNLREQFFKDFMSFTASNNLADVASKVTDSGLRSYLLSLGESTDDFDDVVINKLNSGRLNSNDHLLGMLFEMTNGAQS